MVVASPKQRNVPSKTRAGRILGRSHAALGEHELSVAALEAAIEASKVGELLLSEALTVRARALVGKAASATGEGGSSHWDSYKSKQRLQEVMGRMDGGRPGLVEKLMLHGGL